MKIVISTVVSAMNTKMVYNVKLITSKSIIVLDKS